MSKSSCFGLVAYALMLFALCFAAEAQQSKKIPRIAYLTTTFASEVTGRVDALRQGLHQLGYLDGKNIVIEYRYGEGKPDRLPALAAELIDLKVDLIVTHGFPPARAAKQATTTIPIVMAVIGDAVGAGLVASLARPGGNITGMTSISSEMYGKRLELHKRNFTQALSRSDTFFRSEPSHRNCDERDKGHGQCVGRTTSNPTGAWPERSPERIRRIDQGGSRCCHHLARPAHQFLPEADC